MIGVRGRIIMIIAFFSASSAICSLAWGAATLVGITGYPNDFVKVNTSTGELTVLSNVGGSGYGFPQGIYDVDSNTHKFYMPRYNGSILYLITIDTKTGALTEIPNPLQKELIALGFDISTDILCGVTGYPNDFVHIDTSTGAYTTVGNVGCSDCAFPQGISDVDPNNHMFYMLRYQPEGLHLIAVDIQTGTIVAEIPLRVSLLVVGYDPAADILFGVTGGAPNQFVHIDRVTGELTVKNNDVGCPDCGFPQGIYDVDPAGHKLYWLRNTPTERHLISIDTQTGGLVVVPEPLERELIALAVDSFPAPAWGCPSTLAPEADASVGGTTVSSAANMVNYLALLLVPISTIVLRKVLHNRR